MDSNETSDRPAADVSAQLLRFEIESDVLALPTPSDAAVETPLAAEDEQALEAGIASMFESLVHSDAVYVAESSDDVEPTFALLDELNRLWAQPLAA